MCMCVSAGPYADTYGYTYAFMIPLVYVGVRLFSLLNGFLPSLLLLFFFFSFIFFINTEAHIGVCMLLNKPRVFVSIHNKPCMYVCIDIWHV